MDHDRGDIFDDAWLDSRNDADEWELNEVYADFAAGEYD